MYKLSNKILKVVIVSLLTFAFTLSNAQTAGVYFFDQINNKIQFDDDVVLKKEASPVMFIDALLSRQNKDLVFNSYGSIEVLTTSEVEINSNLKINSNGFLIPGDLIASTGKIKIKDNLNIKLDGVNLTFYDVNPIPLAVSKALTSSSSTDINNIPSNGIFIKGALSVGGDLTFGVDPSQTSNKVDVAGKLNSTSFCVKGYCWNQLLSIPNNLLKIDSGAAVVNDMLATFDGSGNLKNSNISWSNVLKYNHTHEALNFENDTLTNANVSSSTAISRDKIEDCTVSDGTATTYRSFVGFWNKDSQSECTTYCSNSYNAEVGLWLDMTGSEDLCMCFDEVNICI